MFLLRSLIGVNIAIFLLWFAAGDRSGPLYVFMARNFVVSRAHLADGRFWTLVTSAFSQFEIWHLALNMMVLYSFGPVLIARWRPRRFLVFYLAAAIVASLGHVAVGWLIGRHAPALGASGAVSALLAAFSVFHPRHRILLFGFVPLPAYVGTLLFVGLDVWGLVAQSGGGGLPIGHGAHLGGAAFGVAYAWLTRGAGITLLTSDEVTALLDKVRAGGVEALSPAERQRLDMLLRQTRGG